jgi:hypothetical protein
MHSARQTDDQRQLFYLFNLKAERNGIASRRLLLRKKTREPLTQTVTIRKQMPSGRHLRPPCAHVRMSQAGTFHLCPYWCT